MKPSGVYVCPLRIFFFPGLSALLGASCSVMRGTEATLKSMANWDSSDRAMGQKLSWRSWQGSRCHSPNSHLQIYPKTGEKIFQFAKILVTCFQLTVKPCQEPKITFVLFASVHDCSKLTWVCVSVVIFFVTDVANCNPRLTGQSQEEASTKQWHNDISEKKFVKPVGDGATALPKQPQL